jgi:RimJ/RimL family protein N-acetyltransferase
MAWTDYSAGLGEIVPSPYDTARFGYAISRITVGTRWRESAASVSELANALWTRVAIDPADIVFVRYPSSLIGLPTAGIAMPDRTLLPAGSIVYWSCDVRAARQKPLPDGIDVAVPEVGSRAGPFLDALEDAFTDYTSHYSANPLFDASLIPVGYREWAETTLSSSAGRLYGLIERDVPTGVAITRLLDTPEAVIEIELAGIVTDAQGHGRYRHLLDAICHDAREAGVNRIVISTQSDNIRVQRAWASAGYKPELSIDTVHAVRTSLLAKPRPSQRTSNTWPRSG